MHADPRWESRGRDKKAREIMSTLRLIAGDAALAGRWLDLGCGSGGIALALSTEVEEVDAIDVAPWKRWTGYMAQRPNLVFRAGECDSPGGLGAIERYDVVVCNQVYEHVRDPEQLLANTFEALKPGGICYFAGPNLLWPIEPHVHWPVVHWLPRAWAIRVMTALGSSVASDLDAYSASAWTLLKWFEQAGFEAANAIPARLSTTSGAGRVASAMRLAGRLPAIGHALFLPFMPSFIFILRRPSR